MAVALQSLKEDVKLGESIVSLIARALGHRRV